jgi:NAD(P)-dependent dehydrogenase (short-subunit alcohol dehydrogenase family)
MLAGLIGEDEAIRWAAVGGGSPALAAPRKGRRALTVGGDPWPASDRLDAAGEPHDRPTLPLSKAVRLATFLASEDGAAPFADPVAETVGAAWRGGARCDWIAFQGGAPFLRTALPTYPFARTPMPDPLAAAPDDTAARGASHGPLWIANWRPLPSIAPAAKESGPSPLVLLHEECALALPLGRALSKLAEVTVVPVTAAFDPGSIASGAHVVFLCAPSADAAAMKQTVTLGRDAAVALGRRAARFDCVGAGLFEVLGGDVSCGGGAALHALLTTLRLERRVAQGRAIDADPWAAARGKLVEAAGVAARMIATPEAPSIVAIRGRQAFERYFESIECETAGAPYLRPGGVYVLVGGAGGLGLAIARRLAAIDGTRIAIMGRSVDEATQPRLAAAIGVSPERLLAIALDVSEASSVGRALAEVMREFGGLDGIFHLAGEEVSDAGGDFDAADLARAFAAKARGAEALVESLPVIDVDSAPRFLAIVSSLTATLGFPGQSLYAAANAAAEAIAAATDSGDVRVVAVALDRVEGVGLADPARGAVLTVAMAEHPWIEREHRSNGQGYLPGSAALDLLLVAAASQGSCALEDVVLIRAVPLAAGGNDRLWIRATGTAGGGSVLTLFGDADGGAAGFARARLGAQARQSAAARVDLAALASRCTERVSPPREIEDVVLGPRWSGSLSIRAGDAEWLVTAALAEAAAGDDYPGPVHPALLDLALSSAVGAAGCAAFVPSRYARVALLTAEPLGDRIISHIRLRESSADRALFDVTVMRPDGTPAIEVEGYELVRAVLGARAGATAPALRSRIAAMGSAFDADAAIDAIFASIEASPHRTIWATPGDLAAVVAAGAPFADAEAVEANGATTPPRDALIVVTDAMAGVLGEAAVAPDDDFFALGGDSILALDLIARLGATSSSRASPTLADLYAAPTPRGFAALIEAMSAPVGQEPRQAEERFADSDLDEAAIADVLERFAAANADRS